MPCWVIQLAEIVSLKLWTAKSKCKKFNTKGKLLEIHMLLTKGKNNNNSDLSSELRNELQWNFRTIVLCISRYSVLCLLSVRFLYRFYTSYSKRISPSIQHDNTSNLNTYKICIYAHRCTPHLTTQPTTENSTNFFREHHHKLQPCLKD